MSSHHFDVVVVGAGNAGLTAALAAQEAGARVLVLEAASFEQRGGNSRFTGGIFRTTHEGLEAIKPVLHSDSDKYLDKVTVGPYTVEDYTTDWSSTSEGRQDADLMRLTIERSWETVQWMHGKGVGFEITADKLVDPSKQEADKTYALAPGGAIRSWEEGVGLIENLFAAVEKTDIEVWYDAPGHELLTEGSTVVGVRVRRDDAFVDVHGQVVLAAGGFEANPEMRLRYLGPGWDLVKVRGTRYNQGVMLRRAMDAGAKAVGHWAGCHAVPLDANAPDVGDLKLKDKTSRYSYPYALLVNREGKRFIDEGENNVFLTYAKTGRAVLAQSGGVAYQIFDQKALHLLEPRYSTGTPVVADTIEELGAKLGIDVKAFVQTVADYNAAVPADAADRNDPFTLDGVRAEPEGQPAKSNWALTIEQGPFVCYPVTCGVTFTYGGIKIDTEAQVVSNEEKPMPGLYATGEISGGFFYHNYGAGAGLMRGAVFGRIAGTNAARRAAELAAAKAA